MRRLYLLGVIGCGTLLITGVLSTSFGAIARERSLSVEELMKTYGLDCTCDGVVGTPCNWSGCPSALLFQRIDAIKRCDINYPLGSGWSYNDCTTYCWPWGHCDPDPYYPTIPCRATQSCSDSGTAQPHQVIREGACHSDPNVDTWCIECQSNGDPTLYSSENNDHCHQ